jgi:hypothetical protein
MDPSLVAVLVTGWTLDDHDARIAAFDFKIRKPFSGDEVQRIMQQALALHDDRAS